MSNSEVCRQHVYYPSDGQTLFGWVHTAGYAVEPPCAVVICNPLGYEYMSGYRSIRHLADHISSTGIPALRFDYAFTGNSSGSDFESASIAQILNDVRNSVAFMQRTFDQPNITVMGVGLGATFAAAASQRMDPNNLVLWNPTVKGKRYVRELRLLSNVLSRSTSNLTNDVDAAGVFLSDEMQDELSALDLTLFQYSNTSSVLLIDRDDVGGSSQLADTFAALPLDFEYVQMPGYKEMMDVPTDTVVPVSTIAHIVKWLRQSCPDSPTTNRAQPASKNSRALVSPDFGDKNPASIGSALEYADFFSPNDALFGIATLNHESFNACQKKTAFVFINCGSEHHVGPQRLYTTISRKLADAGFLSFRFDLEGIGESSSAGNNIENVPYSPTALKDVEHALEHLKNTFSCSSFVVTGVCAGAYHSFKAAIEIDNHEIKEAILINPLVFEWHQDRRPDEISYEMNHYRSSMKASGKWLKLLTGNVSVLYLVTIIGKTALNRINRIATRFWNYARSIPNTDLPEQLDRLHDLQRRLTVVYADSDPGYYMMMTQAKRQTVRGQESGEIVIRAIDNADHALSKKSMRYDLVKYFVDNYAKPALKNDSSTKPSTRA